MTNKDDMQMLYNTVCCEQRENCQYNTKGYCHSIPYDIVLKSINKLKTDKNDGYEGGINLTLFPTWNTVIVLMYFIFLYLHD